MSSLKSVLYSTASHMRQFISKMFNVAFKSKSLQSDINMNEILFYGADDKEQSKQIGLNNILCIYYVVLHASRTVDVCVPSLVSETIINCLMSVQQRNKVKIRVTLHNSDDFQNLQCLSQNGIEVRVFSSAVALEHEFILVDASENFEDAVAMLGSLDYETSRVNHNRDATVLTSDAAVVRALKNEFERVWYSSANIIFEYEGKDYELQSAEEKV